MAGHGFFLLARGWMDNKVLAGESFCRRAAWVWLIEHAVFRPASVSVGGVRVDLRRGQLAVSIRYLAAVWRWSVNRVVRFLGDLETDTMVSTAADTGITVITVCNYEKYQFPVAVADTATDTGADTG